MKRLFSVTLVMLGTLLWSVQPAYASLWDWLQEFSGPGPYHARLPNWMIDVCQQPIGRGPLLSDFEVTDASRQSDPKPVTCVFADVRFFANDDNDNFGVKNVHVNSYDFGASAPLHRAVSLGFGAGLMNITTPASSTNKFVLTAPRVVIKPLLLYGTNDFWSGHKVWYAVLGSVKYYLKEQIVVGHVRGEDFGLKVGDPNFNFNTQNERLASTGFIIDLSPAVSLLH